MTDFIERLKVFVVCKQAFILDNDRVGKEFLASHLFVVVPGRLSALLISDHGGSREAITRMLNRKSVHSLDVSLHVT